MKRSAQILEMIRGSFTQNLGMKVGSLIFAFLLWCYVATNENPLRTRTLSNVPVTYVGAEDMRARALTPSEPLSDILNTVSINVQVETQYLQNTTSDLMSASVDLSGITEPGEYTLPVRVTTNANFITILDVMPSNVTLSIEDSTSKEVPVEVQVTGDESPDLYYGTPRLSQATVEVSGPRTAIEQAARAVCSVDVSGFTQSITATHTLTIYNAAGEEIPSSSFTGVPAVIVEVPIFPMKTVPVDTERIRSQITGVAPGYEVQRVAVTPSRVQIAGPQEALDLVESLPAESITLDAADADVTLDAVKLILPDEIFTAVPDTVSVRIYISAIEVDRDYPGVDVEVKNLAEGLTAAVQPQAVDVTATGTAIGMEGITAEDILPFVDLSGYASGTYEVPIKFENEADLGVTLQASAASVSVTVRQQEEGSE
ncbi:MAG: hypothetical protein HDQ87_03980 [Clostridia bacterium]|nr:hypothetical protein [Clostridia bacterium]